jgi:hypothetical protein
MDNSKDLRLAVLIDADNVPHRLINGILRDSQIWRADFKRIYADWTKPHVAGWKAVLLDHALPSATIQLYNRKNSSDSALIIDAMDILYTGRWMVFVW